MCTLVDRLFMVCGSPPSFEYLVMAAALIAVILFVVRP
jgi:hypothetical protein